MGNIGSGQGLFLLVLLLQLGLGAVLLQEVDVVQLGLQALADGGQVLQAQGGLLLLFFLGQADGLALAGQLVEPGDAFFCHGAVLSFYRK